MSARKNLAQFAKSEIGKINEGINEAASTDEALDIAGDASYFFEGAEEALKASGLATDDFAPVSLARQQLDAQLEFLKKKQAFEAALGGGE